VLFRSEEHKLLSWAQGVLQNSASKNIPNIASMDSLFKSHGGLALAVLIQEVKGDDQYKPGTNKGQNTKYITDEATKLGVHHAHHWTPATMTSFLALLKKSWEEKQTSSPSSPQSASKKKRTHRKKKGKKSPLPPEEEIEPNEDSVPVSHFNITDLSTYDDTEQTDQSNPEIISDDSLLELEIVTDDALNAPNMDDQGEEETGFHQENEQDGDTEQAEEPKEETEDMDELESKKSETENTNEEPGLNESETSTPTLPEIITLQGPHLPILKTMDSNAGRASPYDGNSQKENLLTQMIVYFWELLLSILSHYSPGLEKYTHSIRPVIDTGKFIVLLYLAIFLPFIGVYVKSGFSKALFINILLCVFGFIPGSIHALYIVLQ